MGEQRSSPLAAGHQPASVDSTADPGGDSPASGQPAASTNLAAGSDSAAAQPPAGAAAAGEVVDSTDSESTAATPWLSRGDQLVVALLCVATVLLLLVRQSQVMQWGRAPATVLHADDSTSGLVLDVNTASWVEWLQLEGIGETLARRIVVERETGGPFVSVEDLARVRGIGRKTVDRLRPWVRVGPEIPAAASGKSGAAVGTVSDELD